MSAAGDGDPASGSDKLRARARRADANPELVATAKLIRRVLPGGEPSDEDFKSSNQLRARLAQALAEMPPEQPSTMRELGFGVLKTWEALSEAQRRRRGEAGAAIMFTDLVGFSDWALEAGDEAAVELLAKVGSAEHDAISEHSGVLVKRLGDGSMSVFDDPEDAVRAAADIQRALAQIDVEGYTPQLRAGVHMGHPRKVGKDYLGVDVNIAARVVDAAKRDQILASDVAGERLAAEEFRLGRRRRLKAPGAPDELTVLSVVPID
jgi:adenylate cyclase